MASGSFHFDPVDTHWGQSEMPMPLQLLANAQVAELCPMTLPRLGSRVTGLRGAEKGLSWRVQGDAAHMCTTCFEIVLYERSVTHAFCVLPTS
jgi:hypothetical protein